MKNLFSVVIGILLSVQCFAQFIIKDSLGYYANFDRAGQRFTPWTQFDTILPSQKGKFNIFRSGVYYGVVDLNFNVVIPAKYSKIHFNDNENIIACQSGESSTVYSNSSGLLLYQNGPDTTRNEGLTSIFILRGYCKFHFKEKYIKVERNNQVGAIDYYGNQLFDLKYDDCFEYKDVILIRKGHSFGAYPLATKKLFEPEYNAVALFQENSLRFVKKDSILYYKYNGLQFPYSDSIPTFVGNNLKIYHNGIGHIYDYQTMERVVDHEFDDIIPLNYNFMIVQNGRAGIINMDNQVIVNPQYKNIIYSPRLKDAENNYYVAINTNDSIGLIDQNNNIIIPFEYTYISSENKYFIAQKGDKTGVYNKSGKLLIPEKLDFINHESNGYIFKSNGMFGFLSETLDTIVNNDYTSLKRINKLPGALIFEKNQNDKLLMYYGSVITTKQFTKVNKSEQWIKTYTNDSIYYHYFADYSHDITKDNDYSIKARVSYPNTKSVNVNFDYKERSVGTNFCSNFLMRTLPSGDLMVRSKVSRKTGNSIKNIHGNNFDHYAFKPKQKYFTFLGQKIKVYRSVYYFDNCGFVTLPEIAGTSAYPLTINGFSSTEFERALSLNGDIRYYTGQTHPYISDRTYQSICHAYTGELNFEEGDELLPFRSLIERLQDYNTIEINGTSFFNALSENKIIKIKEPQWTINYIDNDRLDFGEYKNARKVRHYDDREFILIVNWDWTYEITREDIKKPVIANMINITPHFSNNNHYFDCINADDQKVLFSSEGKVLIKDYNSIIRVTDYFVEYLDAFENKQIYSISKDLTF